MSDAADPSIPPAVHSRWPSRDAFIAAAKLYAANAPVPFSVRLDRVKAPGASSPNSRAGLSIVCRSGNCGASFRVLQEGFNSGDWIVTQQNLFHQHEGDPKPVKRGTRAAQLVAEHTTSGIPPRQATISRSEAPKKVRADSRERSARASSEAPAADAAPRDPFRVGTHWTSPNAIEGAIADVGRAASPPWAVKGVGYIVAGYWTTSSHASIRFRCVGCPSAEDHGEGACHFSIHLQQDRLGAGAWTVTRAILTHSHSTRVMPVMERTPSPIVERTRIARDTSPFMPSLSPGPSSSRRGSADTMATLEEDVDTDHEHKTPPPPERPQAVFFDMYDQFVSKLASAPVSAGPKSSNTTPLHSARPVLSPRGSFGFR